MRLSLAQEMTTSLICLINNILILTALCLFPCISVWRRYRRSLHEEKKKNRKLKTDLSGQKHDWRRWQRCKSAMQLMQIAPKAELRCLAVMLTPRATEKSGDSCRRMSCPSAAEASALLYQYAGSRIFRTFCSRQSV